MKSQIQQLHNIHSKLFWLTCNYWSLQYFNTVVKTTTIFMKGKFTQLHSVQSEFCQPNIATQNRWDPSQEEPGIPHGIDRIPPRRFHNNRWDPSFQKSPMWDVKQDFVQDVSYSHLGSRRYTMEWISTNIGRISLKRIQGSQMGMTRCHPGGSIDPSGTPSPGTNLGSCMGLKVSHLGSYLEGSIVLGRILARIPPKTGGISAQRNPGSCTGLRESPLGSPPRMFQAGSQLSVETYVGY